MRISEVYNMDCVEYMKGLPDNFFTLAIVDPPYGIDINMNMGRRAGKKKMHKEKSWDNSIPDDVYFNELFRVSKNQIIRGGNYFPLPLTKSWIFWDKCVPTGVSFADGELAWTSFDKTLRKLTVVYTGFQGMENGGKIHPTQKPVLLYEKILENYAVCKKCHNEGVIMEDVVGDGGSKMAVECEYCDVAIDGKPKIFDSHVGSQSSRIAAWRLGFDYWGCELDKDYFEAGNKRFELEKQQVSLFVPEQRKEDKQTDLFAA